MKFSLFAILTIASIILVSCNNTPDRPDPAMTQAQHDRVNQESAQLQAQKAAQNAASQASASVLHYYCPTHPTKGGGAAGTCPDCGTALVHNQAFHNQSAPAATTPTVTNGTNPLTPGSTPVPPAATNANGEYHYTCPNGHPGAGAAGSCSQCGTALVHNAAYHN